MAQACRKELCIGIPIACMGIPRLLKAFLFKKVYNLLIDCLSFWNFQSALSNHNKDYINEM